MEPEDSSHREQREAACLEMGPAKEITIAAASYVKREAALSLHDIIHWIFGSRLQCAWFKRGVFAQTPHFLKQKSFSKGEKWFQQDVMLLFRAQPLAALLGDGFIWSWSEHFSSLSIISNAQSTEVVL